MFIVICAITLIIIIYLQISKTNVLHISRKDVNRIYIVDGNTGNITDVDEDYFDEIYEILENLKLSNKKKVDSTGWNKKIVVCDDNNADELIINTSTKVVVSGYFYDIDSKQGENILNIIDGSGSRKEAE